MGRARSLHFAQIALAGAVIGILLLLSACGGNGSMQQQSSQTSPQLNTQIQYLKNTTDEKLTIFKNTITQMQQNQLDVTVMQMEYTDDLGAFNTATTLDAFQKLSTLIDAQFQSAQVHSIQSFPYIGAAKLQEFQDQLNLLKTYGMDTSSYQQLYDTDQANLAKAQTSDEYTAVFKQIDVDTASMQADLIQGDAGYLITKLNNEANAWGQAHLYHDPSDGQNYIPDSGYTMNGIGYWLQSDYNASSTTADYQAVVNDDNKELYLFQLFQQDYADTTPYNQVHQTDRELMQQFPSLQSGTAIIVSMAQQSLHFFVNGQLVNTFLITTGRWERPTLPGVWLTQNRQSPTEFVSSDPPGSPFWYPPTKINYAILYHFDGYFVHDAWWRNDYGPGTQYPHQDSSGNTSANDGSHGCVNVEEDQMAWLYAHTDFNTQIVIY